MNKIAFSLTFVVLSGAMYLLCANAHIDIFPCNKAHRDRSVSTLVGPPPMRTESGTCSLLAHNRGTSPDGEYERLTGGGFALLGAFCVGIGALGGTLLGFALRRRS